MPGGEQFILLRLVSHLCDLLWVPVVLLFFPREVEDAIILRSLAMPRKALMAQKIDTEIEEERQRALADAGPAKSKKLDFAPGYGLPRIMQMVLMMSDTPYLESVAIQERRR